MKSNSVPLSVIILTFNEEKQIERCIKSVMEIASEVFIIDSNSSDSTISLAEKLNAKVYQHNWENNYARQFNWGLDNLPLNTEWIMRLDADEFLTKDLINEIKDKLPLLDENTTGVILKRRVYFMGKWIKHGGYYPTFLLRIWRTGLGKCEERWMDEHIKLNKGKSIVFEHDFIDNNLNGLTWWTNKHNNYSTRESVDLLNIKYGFNKKDSSMAKLSGGQDKKKRWIKENAYSNLPLFIRPFLYFVYRYFLRLGFLDGLPGLIWHFLQGFWYRFLVDAKIYDIERRAENENKTIPEIVKEYYGIDI